jgi:hypothetical protein
VSDDEAPMRRQIAGIPAPVLIALYFVSIVVLMVGMILFMSELMARRSPSWTFSSPSAVVLLCGMGMLFAIAAVTTIGWFQMSRFSLSEFLMFSLAAGAALSLTEPRSPFYLYSGLICAMGAFSAGVLASGILSLWTYPKRLRAGVLIGSAIIGTGFGQPWLALMVLLGFLFSMPLLGVVRHPSQRKQPIFPRPDGGEIKVVSKGTVRTENLN